MFTSFLKSIFTLSKELTLVDKLISNRRLFDKYVYTPLEDALHELEKRSHDPKLDLYLKSALPHGIPEIMRGKLSIALVRNIATPNYEIQRFIMLSDLITSTWNTNKKTDSPNLQPLLLEYLGDKFADKNDWKHSLGKISLHKGRDKNNDDIFEFRRIIDFYKSNGQPFSKINTLWGQPLVDFHHELFLDIYPSMKDYVFDLTEWFNKNGKEAKSYYKNFLSLFLRDGIIFENFMLEGTEHDLTRDVILPAIMEIESESGYKPLILALEPTKLEHERFWLSHPHASTKDKIKTKSETSLTPTKI